MTTGILLRGALSPSALVSLRFITKSELLSLTPGKIRLIAHFFLWMLISKFLTILNNEVSLFKSNLCESEAQASDCFKYSISERFASVWCHWQVEGLQGLLRHTALVVSTEDPSTCCTNFVCKGQPFRRNLAPMKGEGSWNGLFRRRLVEWLQWDPVQD